MKNWAKQRMANLRLIITETDKAIPLKLTFLQKIYIYLDFHKEVKLHGIQLIDYLQYEFYWKKNIERRKFVCLGEARKILQACNNKKFYYIFDRKAVFNRTFSEFLGRNWIDTSECSYEEFCDFIEKVPSFFIKPEEGSYGIGAGIVVNNGTLDYKKMYEEYKDKKILMEEVVTQHDALAEFNISSVNTLRVVTFLRGNGSVQITAAALRIGREGKIADNFHHHGIASLIDLETGIVKTTGIDRDFKRYVVHPDSGKPIVGFKIPNWDKIVDTVKRAALVVPEVRYIGWDIAIGKDGQVIIIEGNKSADHDVTQITDQVGKWPMYKELLNELETKKRKK